MSGSRLVRDSPDLARLVNEGFAVRVLNGFLVVDDIPFVAVDGHVRRGSLICPLDLNGDRTTRPADHVMCFVGGEPRDRNAQPIPGLVNSGVALWSAGPGLTADCGFSQKPAEGYANFYDKITTYAAILVGPAHAVDPSVSALTAKPVETDEDDGVFRYLDTFSSRAGITDRNQRLAVAKVVIVGLGGTGAYLLDLLAKTPIREIHLYDDDVYGTHNAFRAPGAPSLDELRASLLKVDYHAAVFGRMRRGIVAHPARVTADNVVDILDADFVFLAVDANPDKKAVVEALVAGGVPFVDTGIGVEDEAGGIAGSIRVTSSTPGRHEHIARDGLIAAAAGDAAAAYETNLQVAELNALAAVLAVIRFKKTLGFYADSEHERHSVYRIDVSEIYHRYGQGDTEHEPRTEDAP